MYPFTFPVPSETAINIPTGPFPSMRRVTESLVLLSIVPIIEAAVSSLPSAAVTTAEVL